VASEKERERQKALSPVLESLIERRCQPSSAIMGCRAASRRVPLVHRDSPVQVAEHYGHLIEGADAAAAKVIEGVLK
jgi:hypothetical protein